MENKSAEQETYLKAGRFIESPNVPQELQGALIIVLCRTDIPQDKRIAVLDEKGEKIHRYDGPELLLDYDTYANIVAYGYVDIDGVDSRAVKAAAMAEVRTPVLTCEGMEHIADLEIHRKLYRDMVSGRFYWENDGEVEHAPWTHVAHHLAVGYLRYEKDGDEHRLIKTLQKIEEDERRRQDTETEPTETDEPEPVYTCEGMEYIADLDIHDELYYDPQVEQLYWDRGEAVPASWRQAVSDLDAGNLRYEQYEDKQHLMEIIRSCEASEKRQMAAEKEAARKQANVAAGKVTEPPQQGSHGRRILAVVMFVLGIALGYALALVLLR